jgi:hypothetical protein
VRLPLEFSDRLFGITKVGMTVVIADDASQPESVVHPGMVLGDYAAQEFAAVDATIKQSAYAEGHETAPKSSSVVVSSADKSITVFDNGVVTALGRAEIDDPQKPLGNRVFTLTGSDDQTANLRWEAAGIGATAKQNGEDDGLALRRVKADPATREALRKRLRFGTTVVTTDEPANAKTRSATGFVVIDSAS